MSGSSPAGYRIRPLTTADREALAELPSRISARSATARFHGAVTMLTDKTLDLLLDIEAGRHEAIIAVDHLGIVGVARYARDQDDPETAEVAVLVADEWQHRGVARDLLRPLMAKARSAGIKRFRAEILADNDTAIRFFAALTPTARRGTSGPNVLVTVDLDEALAG